MPRLERVNVTDGTKDFYFLTTAGLYTDDFKIETGISGPTADDDYGLEVISSCRDLINGGVIVNVEVILKDTSTNKRHLAKLHCETSKYVSIASLVGKSWPTGKYAGLSVFEINFPARVKSTF